MVLFRDNVLCAAFEAFLPVMFSPQARSPSVSFRHFRRAATNPSGAHVSDRISQISATAEVITTTIAVIRNAFSIIATPERSFRFYGRRR